MCVFPFSPEPELMFINSVDPTIWAALENEGLQYLDWLKSGQVRDWGEGERNAVEMTKDPGHNTTRWNVYLIKVEKIEEWENLMSWRTRTTRTTTWRYRLDTRTAKTSEEIRGDSQEHYRRTDMQADRRGWMLSTDTRGMGLRRQRCLLTNGLVESQGPGNKVLLPLSLVRE